MVENSNPQLFTNVGNFWSKEEDIQLNELYNNQLLDIMEISKIHKRAPGGIISRLRKHNYIQNCEDARGYAKFKNSDFYYELKKTNKIKKNNFNESESFNIKNDILNIKNDILNLKNEMFDSKKQIFELNNNINYLIDIIKKIHN